MLLAVAGPAHPQRAAGHRGQVVGVVGLAQLEHHVVGGVDHVVDGAHAERVEPLGRSTGARARRGRRLAGPGRGTARTGRGRGSRRDGVTRPRLDRRSTGSAAGRANGTPRRAARSRATPATDMASGRLGLISRSYSTSGARPSASAIGVPGLEVGGSRTRMPAWSSPSPSSRRGAQHAVGPLAAHLAAGDLHAVGHGRAERGERHQVAHGHVEGAAADLEGLAVAGVDVDQLDPVGVGVGPQVEHPGHDDAVEPLADAVDRLDGHAEVAHHVAEHDSGRPRRARTRGARTGGPSCVELLQEADVAGDISRRSSHAVADQGQAVDAEAEREAGPLLGVEAARWSARWGGPSRSRRAPATLGARATARPRRTRS